MKKLLLAATLLSGLATAHAATFPTNTTPAWESYLATGNTADIVSSPTVAAAIGTKVDATSGQSLNQQIQTPTITGGTVSATDVGAAVSTASSGLYSGTKSRTLSERAMSMPQAADFLGPDHSVTALLTGNVDVGPLINSAITAGVKTIHLPCGTYELATKIVLASNTSISGDGACTILSVQTTTDDVIYGQVQFATIHDLIMQADAARTSGGAITFFDGYANSVYNVKFTNGSGEHWTDIYVSGSNSTRIENITGRGGNNAGIVITGSDKRSEDTYISRSGFDGYADAPIDIMWGSGIYMSDLDLLGGTNAGVYVRPTSAHEVDGLRATAVLADSNYGAGWRFEGAGAITEINLTNCWGATNGVGGAVVAGLLVNNPNLSNFTVASSEFHANTGAGIDIDQGTRVIVNGNTVFMNSTSSSAGAAGIHIGGGTNYVSVTNNMSGAGGEAQGTATISQQSYAVASDMTGSNYGLFSGNMGTGNTTGGFDIATGTNVTASNNVGL